MKLDLLLMAGGSHFVGVILKLFCGLQTKASSRDSINQYFDVLEDTLDQYDLHGKPNLVFNMDKTGLPLDPILSP